MTRKKIVRAMLAGRNVVPADRATAFAPINIALCKYWGKRNREINLPNTSSLSISLQPLGTQTELTCNIDRDEVWLNDRPVDCASTFGRRVCEFLELFRPRPDMFFTVRTTNTVPTAAGLASSASGYAALTLALDRLFSWNLSRQQLSILARLGSGSAARSVYTGFVVWHAGVAKDGQDSYAERFPSDWPELRVGIVEISSAPKAVTSREAMQRTVATSTLYQCWRDKVACDMDALRSALVDRDFQRLGETAESNALSMHATMLGAWPPVLYWLPETVTAIHRVHRLRENDIPVYITMDAGPNIKLLFPSRSTSRIEKEFPGVRVIAPFGPESGKCL